MSEVTKNEVAKFLEELLLVGDPWEVQSVSHQMGGVDRSVERCAGAMTRRCGNGDLDFLDWRTVLRTSMPRTN